MTRYKIRNFEQTLKVAARFASNTKETEVLRFIKVDFDNDVIIATDRYVVIRIAFKHRPGAPEDGQGVQYVSRELAAKGVYIDETEKFIADNGDNFPAVERLFPEGLPRTKDAPAISEVSIDPERFQRLRPFGPVIMYFQKPQDGYERTIHRPVYVRFSHEHADGLIMPSHLPRSLNDPRHAEVGVRPFALGGDD